MKVIKKIGGEQTGDLFQNVDLKFTRSGVSVSDGYVIERWFE